jgi:hypothetical protein
MAIILKEIHLRTKAAREEVSPEIDACEPNGDKSAFAFTPAVAAMTR